MSVPLRQTEDLPLVSPTELISFSAKPQRNWWTWTNIHQNRIPGARLTDWCLEGGWRRRERAASGGRSKPGLTSEAPQPCVSQLSCLTKDVSPVRIPETWGMPGTLAALSAVKRPTEEVASFPSVGSKDVFLEALCVYFLWRRSNVVKRVWKLNVAWKRSWSGF